MFKVGIGYDVHRFGAGRPLILGGIEIDYPRGLLGHSDADVLIHAIIDALLGAAGEGDIGKYFPDTDKSLKDISSLKLLERVVVALNKKGLCVQQVDTVIIAEKPKIAPYAEKMRSRIAEILNVTKEAVNIKATTTEGMCFTGRGEGIAAQAVAVVSSLY